MGGDRGGDALELAGAFELLKEVTEVTVFQDGNLAEKLEKTRVDTPSAARSPNRTSLSLRLAYRAGSMVVDVLGKSGKIGKFTTLSYLYQAVLA